MSTIQENLPVQNQNFQIEILHQSSDLFGHTYEVITKDENISAYSPRFSFQTSYQLKRLEETLSKGYLERNCVKNTTSQKVRYNKVIGTKRLLYINNFEIYNAGDKKIATVWQVYRHGLFERIDVKDEQDRLIATTDPVDNSLFGMSDKDDLSNIAHLIIHKEGNSLKVTFDKQIDLIIAAQIGLAILNAPAMN